MNSSQHDVLVRLLNVVGVVLLFSLISCAEQIPDKQNNNANIPSPTESNNFSLLPSNSFEVSLAAWNSSTKSLLVNGVSSFNSERIRVYNASSDDFLASSLANKNNIWSVAVNNPEVIPCQVKIMSESGEFSLLVSNAPDNCDSQNITPRVINTNNNIVYPNALIVEPTTDLSIALNDSVTFSGNVEDSVGGVAYNWQFSGVVPNSTIQNPGKIKFTKTGVYHIALDVTDSRGLSDIAPPMRMITVFDNTINPLTATPIANIDTPVGDQTINIGDTINFTASGSDPASNETVTFLWNLDGVAPNVAVQNPGDITFNMAGVFTIVLSVSDAAGNIGTAQVIITVVDPTQTNMPPVGMITEPAGDLLINPGDTIQVSGSASDPEGDTQLSFFWEFDGVVPDTTVQTPGMITYPNEGVFTIRLIATDSMGLADPNPPVRTITVQAPTPISSDLPNGEILTPSMDTTINAGESIVFTGMGSSPTGNEPLNYIWSFDGVAADIMSMDAGSIMFPNPGTYTVTLLVLDSLNQLDPTPAMRVITVLDPNIGTPPPMPVDMVGHIVMPETDVTISPGQSVIFSGMVSPELNPPYSYLWLFDGVASNSNELMPGEVIFPNPGVFTIMFFAIDKDGIFDTRPAVRNITVVDAATNPPPTAATPPPSGMIFQPTVDMVINQGDTIDFLGSVIDNSGMNMLSYFWTFGGGAQSSNLLSPGPVTFDIPGSFTVTFLVADYSDPANVQMSVPSTRNIMVMPAAMPGPGQTPAEPIVDPTMPNGLILSPPGDMTVSVGSTLEFVGDGINPVDNDPLNYNWDFGNGTFSMAKIPGNVTFNQVGTFTVTLSVNHDEVEFDPTPAVIVITVEATGSAGLGVTDLTDP